MLSRVEQAVSFILRFGYHYLTAGYIDDVNERKFNDEYQIQVQVRVQIRTRLDR